MTRIERARQPLWRAIPFAIVALAALTARTPIAVAWPLTAALLLLWIAADTMMLALLARSEGRPAPREVLGVLAGAAVTVAMAAPPALRSALFATAARPVMALVLLAHLGWGAVCAHRAYTGAAEGRWAAALGQLVPPALVRVAAAELTVIHMALFRWSGPADVPAGARAFTYHRHLTPMCAALLILSGIEMAVYHLLIGHWSRTAAVVMFVVSDLGFVYLVGLIKSFRFRPVLVTAEGVRVRAGLLADRMVPFDAIAGVGGEITGALVNDRATWNAALLAWPNIILDLDRGLPRRGLLGRGVPCRRVAFRLDEPEAFVRLLRWRLGQSA